MPAPDEAGHSRVRTQLVPCRTRSPSRQIRVRGVVLTNVREQRGPWQRSYSTPVRNRLDRTPSTISEATRQKLEKLKFKQKPQEPQPEAHAGADSDKENVAVEAVAGTAARKEDETKAEGSNMPSATPVKEAGLARPTEFDSRAEDEEREVSPNDRLLWAAIQDERDAAYPHLSDLARRKNGRKRARSSSPISSPLSKSNSPAINFKKLAQALRSPHADPTLELWDRYTTAGGVAETGTRDVSAARGGGLYVTSSPKPPANGPDTAPHKQPALRRTVASTRLQFNKRRKLDHEEDAPADAKMGASSKYSLMTSLLDSVTSSMQDQEPSPLSNRERLAQTTPVPLPESPSPRKRTRPSGSPSLPRSAAPGTEQVVAETGKMNGEVPPHPAESDYDDDDFDDDIFMAIDAQIGSAPLNPGGAAQNPAGSGFAQPTALKTPPRNPPRRSPRKNLPVQAEPAARAPVASAPPYSDDYGLDDDDLDDNTLMQIADQATLVNPPARPPLESTTGNASAVHKQTRGTTEPRPAAEEDLLDDDFGDDADWDAVELAATQAVASQPKSQHTPRPSNVAGSNTVCHHAQLRGDTL
jgi:DNA replication ATP-dependent helicase Dna2